MMKAEQVVEKLQQLIQEYGNLPVSGEWIEEGIRDILVLDKAGCNVESSHQTAYEFWLVQ